MGLQWQYALVTLVHQIIHSIHILMKTSVQCLYKRNSAQTIGEEGGGRATYIHGLMVRL